MRIRIIGITKPPPRKHGGRGTPGIARPTGNGTQGMPSKIGSDSATETVAADTSKLDPTSR
jgi:hypothetical protein